MFIVVSLVLSFIASPAAAQFEPQVGTVDEDGDLVEEVLQPSGAALEGAFPGGLSLDGFFTEEVIGVDTFPVSPASLAIVKDKTPTFIFSKDASASKYQIEVWNASNATLVYKFKGSGACGATECSLTPTTKLKTWIYGSTQGSYAWKVRSKTNVGWGPFSSATGFFVISNGFNSTFDTHHNKWLAVHGDWFRVDPGYLKTKGVLGEYASVIQKEWFEDQFVYEVTMKRKVKDNSEVYSNRIYFLGNIAGDVHDGWDNGYEFLYYDDGYWFLNVRSADSFTQLDSGSSPFINPYGWNKLTVLTDYPWLDVWINEQYVGFSYIGDDAVKYIDGYVGIGGYKGIANTSLLVDKAKLYYSSSLPYPFAMSADGVRDPAYELAVDPNVPIPVE